MEKIAIVGMGKMGSAIQELLQNDHEITGIGRDDSLGLVHAADTVILAVKPQVFEGGLGNELWRHIDDRQRIISVMAGITTQQLCRMLGTEHVVRTMPNITNSMIAWYTKDENADDQALFSHWGSNIRLQCEEQIDSYTAVGGSGPAFVLLWATVMDKMLQLDGFEAEQSRQIVAYTFQTAADLAKSGKTFDESIRQIASRGGTTEAGLNYAKERDFEGIARGILEAARRRSQQLGSG